MMKWQLDRNVRDRKKPIYQIVVSIFLTGTLSACVEQAVPAARTETNTPIAATRPANQSLDACTAFDNRIWAQTIYDEDPGRNGALDLDEDGLACEELPGGIAPALWTDAVPAGVISADLVSVTDGDTIVVLVDGRRERVRLVGVDAHEAGGPYQGEECYGPEASRFLKGLLGAGGELSLEQDLEDRDRYGRLLRWVWVESGDGEVYLLNEALVRAGYAERFRNTPNRRYVEAVIDAEAFALRHELGLWNACDSGASGTE